MRIAGVRCGLVGALLLFASAAGAQPPSGDPIADLIKESETPVAPVAPVAPAVPDAPIRKSPPRGTLEDYLAGLRKVSCPKGTAATKADAIAIQVRTTPLQMFNPMRTSVGQLSFVGGFDITSEDERFGGLSGVDVLDDGNLLAISDTGAFVWIDVAEDGFTPVAARLSEMHDARGRALLGKTNGDAEGVAVLGGMTLVSFEGNHRVLAFDTGGCGAAARGAPIVTGSYGQPMAEAFAAKKLKVGSNEGAEPLAVTPDWYMFTGIETKSGEGSRLSARPIEAAPEFDLVIAEGAPEFVGLDLLQNGEEVRAFSLHRSPQALSGAAIVVKETVFERYLDQAQLPARRMSEIEERSHWRFRETSSRTLAEMNVLLTIDNYEGIAATRLPDGRVRLFILSDNNFSTSQRTLLMVFDVK